MNSARTRTAARPLQAQQTMQHLPPLSTAKLTLHNMKPLTHIEEIKVVHFTETPVAVLEHRGDVTQLDRSVQQFIAWRQQHGLPPAVSATFNIFYDNPEEVPANRYRLDLCAAVNSEVPANTFGIVRKIIPGGRCAVFRHRGSDETLGDAIRFLYTQWLRRSGEVRRDFPLFAQRVTFFPHVPEYDAITDIFLPLR